MQRLMIKRVAFFFLPVFLLLSFSSCDRVKHKGEQVTEKVRQKIADTRQIMNKKRQEWKERFEPDYNYRKPDTKHNKERFRQYLKVEPSDDVRDIYAYGDFLGLDYKVLIAFTCNRSTYEEIIAKKNLHAAGRKGGGLFFGDEFPWWDKNKIDSLDGFSKGQEYGVWEYLWYDAETKRAFFEEYSM